jgi:hypothetical protein
MVVTSSKGHDFSSKLPLLLFAWAPKDLATTARLSANSLKLGSDKSNCRTSQSVHTGYGAHPASFPMYSMGSFPGGKAAGTWV